MKSHNPSNSNSGSNFNIGNILRGSVFTNDTTAKRQASQYSLSLIKSTMDHLMTANPDGKFADVDQLYDIINEFNEFSFSADKTDKYPCSNEMLKELIKDHERIIVQLEKNLSLCYEKYKDVNMSNVLNGIIEEHRSISSTLKKFLIK